MSLEALEALLEAKRGGVFFVPGPVAPKAVQAVAKSAAYAFFHIDGKNIGRKEQLLTATALALRFPSHFGQNWDALEECLGELESNADGFVILYDHIDGMLGAHPDQFGTFVEICRDAVASWKEDGVGSPGTELEFAL